jgi:hypothetical protein
MPGFKGPKDINDDSCKIPPVQDKLAFTLGDRFAFEALPGLAPCSRYLTEEC